MIIIHAHKVHLQFTSSKKQNRKSLTHILQVTNWQKEHTETHTTSLFKAKSLLTNKKSRS